MRDRSDSISFARVNVRMSSSARHLDSSIMMLIAGFLVAITIALDGLEVLIFRTRFASKPKALLSDA